MGAVARVGEGRKKKRLWIRVLGSRRRRRVFTGKAKPKLLHQWSRELQGEYDSMAENIFTSQGLGLCKQSFTGLTIKSTCKTGLKTQGLISSEQ